MLRTGLQKVGVYSFGNSASDALGLLNETVDLENGTCSAGGGSIWSGSVEVFSITDTEIHFRVTFLDDNFESDPSGEYTAKRCPAAGAPIGGDVPK